MCIFITAILPGDANADRVREIARESRLELDPIENTHVSSQLSPEERLFLTTPRGAVCDCNAALGSRRDPGMKRTHSNVERKVRMLRRRGWSESRIERWREQVAGAAADRRRAAENGDECALPEVRHWHEFIHKSLSSGATPSLKLLIHWYAHGPGSECLELKGTEHIAMNDLTDDHLVGMQEDILYEFALTCQSRSLQVSCS